VATSIAVRADLRRTVPLLMLVVATGHFNRIAISVAGNEWIVPRLGVAPDRMGMVYSAFLLVYTLAMLPGGWFIDRFGPRVALMLLAFGSTVFVALTGVVGLLASEASSVWLGLIYIRAILGLINAPLHPASARMVFEHLPPQSRSMGNGLVTAAACGGIAATYFVFGMLIDRFGWPRAFLISGGMTFIVALIWTFGTRPSNEPSDELVIRPRTSFDLASLLPVLRRRSVICLTLSYSAYGYFQYLFFYWVQYYFETVERQGPQVARGYSTMITIAMGLGMLGGGWLSGRVPRSLSPRVRMALIPVFGMISSGAVFELGLLAPEGRITLAAFVVSAALLGVCEAGFWTSVVELGYPFGGTAAGLMNTGGNAGGTLSPYLTPLLSLYFAEQYGPDRGWRLSLGVAGVIVAAGAAFWWGVDPAKPMKSAVDDRDSLLG
jgi:MFS family permease